MEIREIVTKIKNFKNTIIDINEYLDPSSDQYLFSDESIIYSGSHIFLKSDEEKKRIAHNTLIKQIDQELNAIDIDLTELKILKPKEYELICKDLIPELLNNLKSKFIEIYIFGWPNIEKHILSDVSNSDNQEQDTKENDIILKTQKEKIRLAYELGLIDALITKFPDLNGNGLKISKALAPLLNIHHTSIQPIIRVLLTDDVEHKNYPKLSKSIKDFISSLEN